MNCTIEVDNGARGPCLVNVEGRRGSCPPIGLILQHPVWAVKSAIFTQRVS